MKPNELPQFFAPVRAHIAGLQRYWNEAGFSVLGGCLQFVLQQPEIDGLIVGVNCLAELDEISYQRLGRAAILVLRCQSWRSIRFISTPRAGQSSNTEYC